METDFAATAEPFDVARSRLRSLWGDALRRFMKARLSVAGLVITCVFILAGILGPLIAPYPYNQGDLQHVGELPTWQHLLGTDSLGRDMLSRILWGAQTALLSTVCVIIIALAIGITLGAIAAFAGGYLDTILTWVTDVVMTIPGLLLAVLVDHMVRGPAGTLTEALYQRTHWGIFASSAYSSFLVVFAGLAFIMWPGAMRLVRGQLLSIRELDYIMAARAVGVPPVRMILRHMVPNALGPVIVSTALAACDIIAMEAGLSYLGVGIRPPAASWGSMISSNLSEWAYRPHLVFVPAIVLAVTAAGLGFLGNGLSDALDPRRSSNAK